MYNKRTWLNKPNSPSTGNVVAFEGIIQSKNEEVDTMFLSVSDCYNSARLHKSDYESIEDFIDKMVLLRDEIDEFVTYLKNIQPDKTN